MQNLKQSLYIGKVLGDVTVDIQIKLQNFKMFNFEYVKGDFDCRYNKLTSLQGSPKEVGGDFYCRYNKKEFTRYQVKMYCNAKGRIFN